MGSILLALIPSQVIQLTKELIAEGGPSPSQPPAQPQAPTAAAPLIHPAAAITTAPDLRLPSILPPTVAAQIRSARHRAAFAGQAPAAWAIGAPVQAIYREDGQWYNGVVSAVSVSGKFIVQYEGYDQAEEVEREEVRLRGAEANGGYTGVVAPKKRKVNEEVALEEMPAWLQIKPEGESCMDWTGSGGGGKPWGGAGAQSLSRRMPIVPHLLRPLSPLKISSSRRREGQGEEEEAPKVVQVKATLCQDGRSNQGEGQLMEELCVREG